MSERRDVRFRVLNREKLAEYWEDEPHIVIHIKSPGSTDHALPANIKRLANLPLTFWDLDRKIAAYPDQFFERRHAREILEFVNRWMPVGCIIVACEAGISRSAAVAAALAKVITWHDREFFEYYVPNRRVYAMILNEHYAMTEGDKIS